MGQPTRRDVGINPLFCAGLGVVLAPVAGICRERIGQSGGCGSDALQQLLRRSLRLRLQVFDVGSLVAHAHRHDHLVVAVDSYLAVVALDVVAI